MQNAVVEDAVVIDDSALSPLITQGHVVRLLLNDKSVVIVGTAHVSEDSVDVVTKVVDAVQPSVLMLELCAQRTGLLMPPTNETNGQKMSAFEHAKDVMSKVWVASLPPFVFVGLIRCFSQGPRSQWSVSVSVGVFLPKSWLGDQDSTRFVVYNKRRFIYFFFSFFFSYAFKTGAEFRAALQAVQRGNVPCQV
jgi:hypothetical protein